MFMLGSFEEEFEKIDAKRRLNPGGDVLKTLSKDGVRVVIFGNGVVGKDLAGSLPDYAKKKIVAFCDNYKTGFCKEYNLPVISAKTLSEHYSDAVVIVAVALRKTSDEIYDQVLQLGFSREKVLRCYSGFGAVDWDQHKDGYKWAYDFFDDQISKAIILDRIRGYLSYYSSFEMAHSLSIDQYFEQGVIRFSDHEVFVDGGCYTADTSLAFIERVKGKYDFIYGFEPEAANFLKATENLAPYSNIEIMNKGLWNKTDQLFFHPDGASSTIISNGASSIQVTSLDEFFEDKKALPTFIKLDIEGAEKQALLGMKNLIGKAHPKLAICAYHKPQDVYELPKLILQLGSKYKFKLRHYMPDLSETVLYAQY
ncbi:MAG TPA: FkbM family methyltransferase [Clostridia bacterium]|nr:FkbM family methyltransferase [Clostridia bacterium]